MERKTVSRGLLSGILAVALLLSLIPGTVRAEEAPAQPPEESTQAPTVPTEGETAPPETETTPEATIPPTESTLPRETAAATEPPESTLPPETTVPTLPPETTEPPQTRLTIRYAKTLPEGTENLVIQGTLTCAGYGMTVIQDTTAGIRLTLPEGTAVAPGEVLLITGTRSAQGIAVQTLERKGTGDLPLMETTLEELDEYVRVTMKNLTFSRGNLIQGALTLPMTPASPEGIQPGDRVNVWGVKAEGMFYADKAEPIVPQTTLPGVTATPLDRTLDPGENIALYCEEPEASIFYRISYDGITYSQESRYCGGVSTDASQSIVYLRARAEKEGFLPSVEREFVFTLETQSPNPSTPGTSVPDASDPATPSKLNFYFGQLHAHTNLSDGAGSVEDAFSYAAQVEGLDFFAVTDHSNSFDNAESGSIHQEGSHLSQEWKRGKEAAAAVTSGSFVGLFGYELTWHNRLYGHMNTFNTRGWQTRDQAEAASPRAYYETLAAAPGSISQFNHPGDNYGAFENFAHHAPQIDARVQLLEVGGENGVTAYQYYTQALDAGWHVAPTNNQTNHQKNWGTASSARTVVLAPELTEQALYTAMENRRVYATEDADLEILYRLNGALMGSVIHTPAQTITVTLTDLTDPAGATVEVVTKTGAVMARQQTGANAQTLTIPVTWESPYYYLRITQADGDMAVTAPVWVDLTVDAGISRFAADNHAPSQGDTVNLTLEVFNNEQDTFLVDSVTYYLDDALIYSQPEPLDVAPLGTAVYPASLSCSALGTVELRAVVEGTLLGVRQRFEETLTLQYQSPQKDIPITAISQVRQGTLGETYRIQGYVTAGTSNPRTTFPGTLYLQDDTGGIAVSDFWDSGIQPGIPLTLTGYLDEENDNPTLVLLRWESWDQPDYRFVPQTLPHRSAMNYGFYGGQLLQVEGTVLSLTRTADGKGICWFTMKDASGDIASIRIEEAITSGSTGENRLSAQVKVGKTIRAIGILHLEAGGNPVLRVRNCDEVTPVSGPAAPADTSNPKTGDLIFLPVFFVCGFFGFCLLRKKKARFASP